MHSVKDERFDRFCVVWHAAERTWVVVESDARGYTRKHGLRTFTATYHRRENAEAEASKRRRAAALKALRR